MAYDRHLHFALDMASFTAHDGLVNIPVEALLTAEPEPTFLFRRYAGTELVSDPRRPWNGHLYGSENDGTARSTWGVAPPALQQQLAQSASSLRRSLAERLELEEIIAGASSLPVDVLRARLARALQAEPHDPVALYEQAVELEMRSRQFDGAVRLLEQAQASSQIPRLYEVWVPAWSENQLGAIAFEQHRPEEARRHFQRAQELWTHQEIITFARTFLERLDRRAR